MSVFKRSILLVVSLALIVASLPYVTHQELFSQANQLDMSLNIFIGSIVAIYNFLMIYKKATTIHVVVDSEEIKDRIARKKGRVIND